MTRVPRTEGVTLRVDDAALAKIAAHAARRTPGVDRLAPGLVGRVTSGLASGARRDAGASVLHDADGGLAAAVRVVVEFAASGAGPTPAEVVAAVAQRIHAELSALVTADVRPEVTVVDLVG